MHIEMTDLGNASKISLEGRLDTPGVDKIETRFTAAVAATGRNTVIDLRQVTFISSMGIRMLISTARALNLKKGKMVLFGAQPMVMASFEHVGLSSLMPVVADESEALAALEAA